MALSSTQRRWLVVGVTALVPVAGYFLLRHGFKFNFHQWWASLGHFGWKTVGLALLAVLAQIGFMVNRLWVLCAKDARVPWPQAARAMSYGQCLNHFLPARAGDVVKALYLKRRGTGDNRDLPVTESAGVIIADKVVDTTALLLVILGAMITGSKRFLHSLQEKPLWPFLIGGIAVLLIAFLAYRWLRGSQHRHAMESFLEGLKAVLDPKRLILGVLWGVAVWLGEVLSMHILVSSQGYSFTYDQLVWVLLILNLGVAIPISIANVGTFEAAMSFGLSQLGMPLAPALAVATVHHALQIGGVLLWAGVLWLIAAIRGQTRLAAT